ncbi:MAG: type II toxin-antitoxin system HicA family toxin [Acidimicrobiales bacterium]
MKPRALLERLLAGAVTKVAFSDAQKLLVALGFDELRVRGSHHVFGRPGIPEQLSLQDRTGQAKPYQLRQLVALVRRYDLSIEEDE